MSLKQMEAKKNEKLSGSTNTQNNIKRINVGKMSTLAMFEPSKSLL